MDIDLDTSIPFISSLLHNILFGRIPKTSSINYIDIFKNDYKDESTMVFLINIDTCRKNMMIDLSSQSSLQSKLNSIDLYIPLLFRLYDSICAQPAIQINKSINYEWESGIYICCIFLYYNTNTIYIISIF